MAPSLKAVRESTFSPSSLQAIKAALVWALSPIDPKITENVFSMMNEDPLATAHTTQVQAQQLQLLAALISVHPTKLDRVACTSSLYFYLTYIIELIPLSRSGRVPRGPFVGALQASPRGSRSRSQRRLLYFLSSKREIQLL